MDRSARIRRLFAPVAALSLLAAALALPARAGQAVEEKFEKTYDAAGIDHLRLQNVNGAVRVVTWERPHIRVFAVKRAKGSNAEEAVAATEIRVTKQGSTIDIETILPKPTRTWGLFDWGNKAGAEVTYATIVAGASRRGETAIGYKSAALAEGEASFGVRVNPAKAETFRVLPGDRVVVLAES